MLRSTSDVLGPRRARGGGAGGDVEVAEDAVEIDGVGAHREVMIFAGAAR